MGARFRTEFDRPWTEGEVRRGCIVVIGQTGLDRPAITRHLSAPMSWSPADPCICSSAKPIRWMRLGRPTTCVRSPGDLVFLTFSDSDLGALAGAWRGMGDERPSLRLASLARLTHPMSVDMYLDDVVAQARCVVLRLLGGLDYWRYGAEELGALCRRAGIPLAVVPGDGRQDPALAALSTMPAALVARMDALLAQGGPANMRGAIRLAAHAAGLVADDAVPGGRRSDLRAA